MSQTSSNSEEFLQGPERRRHARHRVAMLCPIALGPDNGGIILNISETGLAMQAVAKLAGSSLLDLHFQLPRSTEKVSATGKVTWTSASKKEAGISFVDLPEEARDQIKEWILQESAEADLEAGADGVQAKGKQVLSMPVPRTLQSRINKIASACGMTHEEFATMFPSEKAIAAARIETAPPPPPQPQPADEPPPKPSMKEWLESVEERAKAAREKIPELIEDLELNQKAPDLTAEAVPEADAAPETFTVEPAAFPARPVMSPEAAVLPHVEESALQEGFALPVETAAAIETGPASITQEIAHEIVPEIVHENRPEPPIAPTDSVEATSPASEEVLQEGEPLVELRASPLADQANDGVLVEETAAPIEEAAVGEREKAPADAPANRHQVLRFPSTISAAQPEVPSPPYTPPPVPQGAPTASSEMLGREAKKRAAGESAPPSLEKGTDDMIASLRAAIDRSSQARSSQSRRDIFRRHESAELAASASRSAHEAAPDAKNDEPAPQPPAESPSLPTQSSAPRSAPDYANVLPARTPQEERPAATAAVDANVPIQQPTAHWKRTTLTGKQKKSWFPSGLRFDQKTVSAVLLVFLVMGLAFVWKALDGVHKSTSSSALDAAANPMPDARDDTAADAVVEKPVASSQRSLSDLSSGAMQRRSPTQAVTLGQPVTPPAQVRGQLSPTMASATTSQTPAADVSISVAANSATSSSPQTAAATTGPATAPPVQPRQGDGAAPAATVTTPPLSSGAPASNSPSPSSSNSAASGSQIVGQGDRVIPSSLLYSVQPLYPSEAAQKHIEGVVKLTAVVGKDGHVMGLGVVSGAPLLVPAALSAAREWRYVPALLNGEPVETQTDIEITFRLPFGIGSAQ